MLIVLVMLTLKSVKFCFTVFLYLLEITVAAILSKVKVGFRLESCLNIKIKFKKKLLIKCRFIWRC